MGFLKKNDQKKEETDSTEKKEYSFSEDVELKACRYCQVMIPKTAKVCPNCRKRLKRNWLGIFLWICFLAACAAGVYFYVTVYPVTRPVSADGEAVRSEEAVLEVADEWMPEEGLAAENGPAAERESTAVGEAMEESMAGTDGTGTDAVVQIENLLEMPTALEGPADGPADGSEAEKVSESENGSEAEKDDESADGSEAEKDDEPENGFEAEKEEESETKDGTAMRRDAESDDAAEEKDRAGMLTDDDADEESDTEPEATDAEPESDAESADGTVKAADISAYTEEEFRDICKQVDYKKLLRRQELYLDTAVTEELTVLEQVDGGLFDENLYYLCKKEDEQGITRYYIIRDDREENAEPILEGDVLRVYGQLFGSCKLPGYLNRTQPVVPALTMVYYDLLEE